MIVSKSHWSESEACLVGSYSLHCPLYGNGERLVVGHMPLSCTLSSERQGNILSFRSCHELTHAYVSANTETANLAVQPNPQSFRGVLEWLYPIRWAPSSCKYTVITPLTGVKKTQLPTRPRPFIWVWTPFITIVGAHLVLKSQIFTRGLRPSQ